MSQTWDYLARCECTQADHLWSQLVADLGSASNAISEAAEPFVRAFMAPKALGRATSVSRLHPPTFRWLAQGDPWMPNDSFILVFSTDGFHTYSGIAVLSSPEHVNEEGQHHYTPDASTWEQIVSGPR